MTENMDAIDQRQQREIDALDKINQRQDLMLKILTAFITINLILSITTFCYVLSRSVYFPYEKIVVAVESLNNE